MLNAHPLVLSLLHVVFTARTTYVQDKIKHDCMVKATDYPYRYYYYYNVVGPDCWLVDSSVQLACQSTSCAYL